MLKCKIDERDYDKNISNSTVLFTPNSDKLFKHNICAATALYDLTNIQDKIVYIRIFNYCIKNNKLPKGMNVGHLTSYKEENVCVIDSDNENKITSQQVVEKIIHDHKRSLNKNEIKSLEEILQKNSTVFSTSNKDFGNIEGYNHQIKTQSDSPVFTPHRRIDMHVEEEVEGMIKDLENQGIIKKAHSPWNSPLVVIKKKNGGLRLCVDYRRLNNVTEKAIFPLPDSQQLFDSIAGSNYFSTLRFIIRILSYIGTIRRKGPTNIHTSWKKK